MVANIIQTVTTAIGSFVTGVGSSVVDFFNTTVLTADGELTTFATWSLVFLGIGFGSMIFKWVTNLVRR